MIRPILARKVLAMAFLAASVLAAPAVPPANAKPPGSDAPELGESRPLGPAWARGRTLYQMHVRNYTREGTIAAAAEHLPRLAELGVGVLWLMPMHPRGERTVRDEVLDGLGGATVPIREEDWKPLDSSPFNVLDHREIDPKLGTEDDFRAFVDRAHELGIKVILGWVPNHTGWDSPILREHPEWYKRGGQGQVLYHKPWKDIAMFDYDGPGGAALAEYMLQARRKFVALGVDGFREDVAAKTPLEHWRWLRARLDPDGELLWLAEAWQPWLYGPFDMTYDWDMPGTYWRVVEGDAGPDAVDAELRRQRELQPPGARRLRYLFNHDQTGTTRDFWQQRHLVRRLYGGDPPTHARKYGPALRAMALLNFTLPGGRPMIFMGEELGFLGHVSHRRVEHAVFPFDDPPDPTAADFYRSLTRLLRDHPALHSGGYDRLDWGDGAVYAYVRALDGEGVVVAANLSDEPRAVAPPDWVADLPRVLAHEAEGAMIGPWGFAVWAGSVPAQVAPAESTDE